MVNHNAPEPISADAGHYGSFRVERDLSDYRGTGGVLHDLAADYDDDDLILVANAAQVLLDPLHRASPPACNQKRPTSRSSRTRTARPAGSCWSPARRCG